MSFQRPLTFAEAFPPTPPQDEDIHPTPPRDEEVDDNFMQNELDQVGEEDIFHILRYGTSSTGNR